MTIERVRCCPASGYRHAASGYRHAASSYRRAASGYRRAASGFRNAASGYRLKVYDLESGIRNPEVRQRFININITRKG